MSAPAQLLLLLTTMMMMTQCPDRINSDDVVVASVVKA